MCTLIFWPWPTLRLASVMPVCIRCAFPICTTPKSLYYAKVTSTAIFFFLKLLRMSPLTMWLFQLYPCLQEAMWIKKRQKIGTMHCSWWEASSSLPSSKDRKEESLSQCLHISLTSAPLFKGSFALLPQEVCHQRWFSHSNKVHALILS